MVLKGEAPKSNTERLAPAQRAYDKSLHAAAVRLFAESLAADPGLAGDRRDAHSYNAACAASLAASGAGKDDPFPDGIANGKLRQSALEWITSELAEWATFVETSPPQAQVLIVQT